MKRKVRLYFSVMAVFISGLFSYSVFAVSDNFAASPLTENILLISGPSGNTLVGVEPEGLVLVEGVPAEYAEEYLNFVYAETGKDNVLALFNTHWHPESVGLNAILGGQGVKIIAHENTKQWLATTIRERGEKILHTPVQSSALPNDTFYIEDSLSTGGSLIQYAYLLQSHTDGDIYVKFSDANVLFTGGTVRSDDWVVMDITTGGFLGGMIDAYEVLLSNSDEDTLIVPISGPVLSRNQLQQQFEMYQGVMASLVDLLLKSQSVAEAVAAHPAAGLQPEWGNPDLFLYEGFRSFYGHLRNGRHLGTMP